MKKLLALTMAILMVAAVFAGCGNSNEVKDYATSVAGANVVAEAGSAGEELATADEFFKEANFTPVDSMAKALMEVSAGTADIAIVDYVTSIGSIGEGTDYVDLKVVEGKDFSPEEYGIAFRKGSDASAAVNEAIRQVEDLEETEMNNITGGFGGMGGFGGLGF